MKYYSYLLILIIALSACSNDFLDPKISTKMTYEQLLTQPSRIEGLVVSASSASFPGRLDNVGGGFLDCGTDNAVLNQETSSLYKISAIPGYLTPNTTIFGGSYGWGTYYENIRDIDEFFDIVNKYDVVFKKSSARNDSIFKRNLFGEAYFIKAWNMAELLKIFGGVDINGELKGVPIPASNVDLNNYEEIERAPYDTCVEFIMTNIDKALEFLPSEWDNSSDPYTNSVDNYGRPTKIVAMALKSRVLLYAASPAYTIGLSDQEKSARWLAAAEAAKEAIDVVGNLPDIYTDLGSFFNDPQNDELIFRRIEGATTSNRMEKDHFIPSLFGKGRCNPTQNLVDAFPMKDGYPSGMSPNYGYGDDGTMYQNRDPRFYATVLYNGATVTYGTSKTTTVETFVGGKDTPAGSLGDVNNTTRTGYYLRKWMSTKVDLTAGQVQNDFHYAVYFTKAEMYLNFAEAANELAALGGPVSVGGMTAEQAIGKIRQRALKLGTDEYLNSISGSPENLRNLIRNERRIELCFEGQRFYDLRRWEDNLDTTVGQIVIDNNTFTRKPLYKLAYKPSEYYLPIHQNEMNRTTLITQNKGW